MHTETIVSTTLLVQSPSTPKTRAIEAGYRWDAYCHNGYHRTIPSISNYARQEIKSARLKKLDLGSNPRDIV